ncbi:HAMP domain-containing histidine kinase [Skermania sp. ID1734]|uniref:sensor histidine kinase n=1 Tax=Skermania sp. ID1734 TaxID=2597516 RepID=UPI00117E501A|nr:HAMP domain-containing sensor histidine kinase [Skermania sp. ID1734]TSD97238.1 HAMP domain-containing histidine kinase [Skermania sp. ID1734]
MASRSPRTWSLRARLLFGQILLLAAVCVGIAAATEFALQQFLVHQLDEQLIDAGHRSASMFGRPPPPLPGGTEPVRSPGPGPDFLDAPGQPAGTVGAVVSGGTVVDAGMLTTAGTRVAISATAQSELAAMPANGEPITLDLNGIGRYRLIATQDRAGNVIITGLSLSDVDATLMRVLLIFVFVTVAALFLATTVGVWVIRRALAPLNRVAQTASRVADLQLDRGEVALPVRVPESDADPRTEVGRLGLALNRMLEHIAAALSSRQASETRVRQFVADASHELRTPLTAIRGYTELAQRKRDELPVEVAHAMGRVESEASRMTHLVDDLLLLARLDSGRPLEQEPVDMSLLAADAVSDAHVAGPQHCWNLELPDHPVVVTGDAARLHQVLANLLANARIHTPSGTRVTVSLEQQRDGVVLTVADDGPGVPESLQPEIFERFARGDSSRSRRAGSTGLGLAIVAAVVKAHRGSISVCSAPGRTAFTVRLPHAVAS